MTLSTTELETLARVAMGATPGPWGPNMPNDFQIEWPDSVYDAAHIAAFHPGTALSLVREVMRLRKVVEAVEHYMLMVPDHGGLFPIQEALAALRDARGGE